jgi:Pectinesterase
MAINFVVFKILSIIVLTGLLSHANMNENVITWEDMLVKNYSTAETGYDQDGSRVLVVSQDGHGSSQTVQGAIDMVPDGNSQRIKILIYPGIYKYVHLVDIDLHVFIL